MSFTAALAPWINDLRALVWRHVGVGTPLTLMLCLLHNRLGRMARRLAALERAWAAGTLRPTRKAGPRANRKPPAARPPRLPGARDWLVKLIPAAQAYRGAVANRLAMADSQALVAAAPQAGRILRPLCRMLGVDQPDWLKLPKRPRKPRPAKPPRPESRTALWRRFRSMTDAELAAWFHPLPPHFNLPIPGYQKIRRRIRAFYAAGGVRPSLLR